jgi:penicillin-binding protein 2
MQRVYSQRKAVLQLATIILSLIFIVKLFFIQVIQTKYKKAAENNAISKVKLYPDRGLIYDRNDELLVFNQPIYDINVIPRQVIDIDTNLFCSLLKIPKQEFIDKMNVLNEGISYYRPNIFIKQITSLEFTKFQEFSYKFNGFYGVPRTIRQFHYNTGALIFGDIGEVDSSDIVQSDKYYMPGDYIGKSGIEKIYEKELRGERGFKYVYVDKFHNEKGAFDDGKADINPMSGKELKLAIDVNLQMYGELLMQNKIGSIVAIQPSTGEILALVSNPTFDPNMLAGRQRSENYKLLQKNKLSPLFNRAIMAQYPPGSTFKPVTAAIALQEEVITEDFGFSCNGNFYIPGYTLHCSHSHPSAGNVEEALQHSCNPYFWQLFKTTIDNAKYKNTEEAYSVWKKHNTNLGLGRTVNIDLIGEKKGNIPGPEYYNKLYRKNRWRWSTIVSLAIGQGEILVTPLQLANLYAIIANRGYYIEPHLLKAVENKNITHFKKVDSGIAAKYFEVIARGLARVVNEGTGRRSKIPGIEFGGKTGTAQNPHGENHSIFAGFAPINNPEIVVAVVVENAGGGGAVAAPISSLIIEKYINDTIMQSRLALEKQLLETFLIDTVKFKQ